MRFYMAPMEGLTGYVYRNAYHQHFSPMDKYFTPFIVPNQNRTLKSRELNDVLPEHNQGMKVVPQILTNNSRDFLWCAEKLGELGYREVNLNLGCPSGTVVSKGRGAGFLSEPDKLDAFLEEVFLKAESAVSVKTRLGMRDEWEFEDLMKVFVRYPIKELIIHPRVREDYYKNQPRLEGFAWGLAQSRSPVCYNGNVADRESFLRIRDRFPQVDCMMLGRGVIANPGLLEVLRREESSTQEELLPGDLKTRFISFHQSILSGYIEIMSGERNVLFKMKELWAYMDNLFEDGHKLKKRIKKAERLEEYQAAVEALFQEAEWRGDRK